MFASKKLEKQEAVEVLNEIIKLCVMPRFIALELCDAEATAAAAAELRGYCLRLRGPFDAKDWECIKGIILKRSLSMKEIGKDITIYR